MRQIAVMHFLTLNVASEKFVTTNFLWTCTVENSIVDSASCKVALFNIPTSVKGNADKITQHTLVDF